MWNEISRWHSRNHLEITWFLLGWLTLSTLDNIAAGNYIWASVSAFLAWAIFKLRKVF
jgi:hypothetical protein